MDKWIFSPPVAFGVVMAASFLFSALLSGLSFSVKSHSRAQGTAYACGEENYDNTAQPDYSTFFPFAFFFTMAHVATMVLTTVPLESLRTFGLALLYIVGVITGLYILLRND